MARVRPRIVAVGEVVGAPMRSRPTLFLPPYREPPGGPDRHWQAGIVTRVSIVCKTDPVLIPLLLQDHHHVPCDVFLGFV